MMESDVAEKAFLLLSSSLSFDRGKKGRKALFSPFNIFYFFLEQHKGNKRLIFLQRIALFDQNSHKKMFSLLIYVKANGRKSWTTRRLARN